MEYFDKNMAVITDLFSVYKIAGVAAKQELLNRVFDKPLYHAKYLYRTPQIIPVYLPKAALLKEERLLEIEQPLEKIGKSSTLYRVRESNP